MGNLIYIIIGINLIVSIQGFNSRNFIDKYIFHEGKILKNKEYYRLITSGFLHANWGHLFFNMLTFYFFGPSILAILGPIGFLALYLASLLGGNLLSLYLKRGNLYYQALGASGAVSGILYAFILPYPWEKIYIMFIPLGIPAWIFGILFVVGSIYGMSRNADNIGHEAHLGGAITGLVTMCIMRPDLFLANIEIALAILLPTLAFLIILVKKPEVLKLGKKNDFERWD